VRRVGGCVDAGEVLADGGRNGAGVSEKPEVAGAGQLDEPGVGDAGGEGASLRRAGTPSRGGRR
jgi:hypothetical protein